MLRAPPSLSERCSVLVLTSPVPVSHKTIRRPPLLLSASASAKTMKRVPSTTYTVEPATTMWGVRLVLLGSKHKKV